MYEIEIEAEIILQQSHDESAALYVPNPHEQKETAAYVADMQRTRPLQERTCKIRTLYPLCQHLAAAHLE